MLLAFDRETSVDMAFAFKRFEQYIPRFVALASLHESVRIANHDHCVPRTREENCQTLRRGHEPDIVIRVAPRERNDDDIAFFSLVVVCVC